MSGLGLGSIVVVACLALTAAACSSTSPTGDASDATAATAIDPTGTAVGGSAPETDRSDPSVPIVDPASTEAFCALADQLADLGDERMASVDLEDPESLRLAFASFFTDNAAVIDQYLAAAPPEIESDVKASIDQARSAVDDPERFEEAMTNTESSNRVSDFIEANCP